MTKECLIEEVSNYQAPRIPQAWSGCVAGPHPLLPALFQASLSACGEGGAGPHASLRVGPAGSA